MYKLKVSNELMQVLKPALPFSVGTIKREILNGVSSLYQSDGGNLLIVLRPENSELVVVAVAGSDLLSSQQEIVNHARISGFKTLRFHSQYPKRLTKGLSGLSYQINEVRKHLFGRVEYVFRVKL